jgi:hypothetical protein
MTEQKNQLASLFAACWKDETLKARFLTEPKSVLAQRGIPVPDDIEVKVVENRDGLVHITIPISPDLHVSLSDEELARATGGLGVDVGGMQTGTCQHQLPSVHLFGILLPGVNGCH